MSLPVPTFRVTALPRPLSTSRDEFHLGHGCTVEDALLEVAYRSQVHVATRR